MCNMLGLGDMNADQLASKLEETLPVIRSVSEQFKDPVSPFATSIASVWSYVVFTPDPIPCNLEWKRFIIQLFCSHEQTHMYLIRNAGNVVRLTRPYFSCAYIRNRPPSSAYVSQSSSPCTRRSGWSRNWPSVASTLTTSSSTSWFSPTRTGRAKCVKPGTKFSPNT